MAASLDITKKKYLHLTSIRKQTEEFLKNQTAKYNFLFKSICFAYSILDIVRSYLTQRFLTYS